MSIRVVVTEEDPLIAEGLARSLEEDQRITCVAAATGEALQRCRERQPCVLLIGEEQFDLLDVQRFNETAQGGRAVRALILGSTSDPGRGMSYLRLGCMGYASRQDSLGTVRRAVTAVAAGEIWAPRMVTAKLVQELLEGRAAVPRLTNRQLEILELIRGGYSNEQITAVLYISSETLRWHLRRLFQAIGVRNRAGAAEFARRHVAVPRINGSVVADFHQMRPPALGNNHLAEGVQIR